MSALSGGERPAQNGKGGENAREEKGSNETIPCKNTLLTLWFSSSSLLAKTNGWCRRRECMQHPCRLHVGQFRVPSFGAWMGRPQKEVALAVVAVVRSCRYKGRRYSAVYAAMAAAGTHMLLPMSIPMGLAAYPISAFHNCLLVFVWFVFPFLLHILPLLLILFRP